jgi:hypothetical protein
VQDVVEHVQIVQQLEVLKHEADVADAKRPPAGVAQAAEVGARHPHLAPLRRDDAGHQIQQRGLAGAARADHGQPLAVAQRKRRDVQPKAAAGVGEVQCADVDHRPAPAASTRGSAAAVSVVVAGD